MAAKTKTASKKTAKKTAKASARTPVELGYKGHRKGTNKEKLHELFDKYPLDKAKAMAAKLEVAPATINTSFSQFRTAGGGKKVAKKASAKKASKKAA